MVQKTAELLVIDNVSKKFGDRTVLENVSAKVSTGGKLGLIGKSAAGKSVLLHMIRGSEEYAPTEGRIIYRVNQCRKCKSLDLPFEGEPCTKCDSPTDLREVDYWSLPERDPLRQAVRERIAIMLQRTFALFGDKTVIENIFEALGDKMGEKQRIDRAVELLQFVNMTHRMTHIARDLSGGEKQRVVLARQLAKDPLFFLADEPTGTLDPRTADMIHRSLVKMVGEKRICMVFASHWPEAVRQMSDEAIWLDSGKMVMKGDPGEVTSKFMEEYHFEREKGSETGDVIIKMTDAKKHFFSVVRGVVKAVDGVTLEIREREIFAFVGLSGAGKTTTSRMIAGMSPCTGGSVTVRIGDEEVNMSESGFGGKGRATPYIGFLHQEYTLYPFDTILQNLTTCIGMKMPAELAKMKAIQVLVSVGFPKKDIDKILYSYPDSLSVGECQRIAFAQVLIKEPNIVILDEPTGTMDPITKVVVAKAVLKAREELGSTFIVVSHDMDFVKNCCDRGVLMENGKVKMEGTPDQIIAAMNEPGNKE